MFDRDGNIFLYFDFTRAVLLSPAVDIVNLRYFKTSDMFNHQLWYKWPDRDVSAFYVFYDTGFYDMGNFVSCVLLGNGKFCVQDRNKLHIFTIKDKTKIFLLEIEHKKVNYIIDQYIFYDNRIFDTNTMTILPGSPFDYAIDADFDQFVLFDQGIISDIEIESHFISINQYCGVSVEMPYFKSKQITKAIIYNNYLLFDGEAEKLDNPKCTDFKVEKIMYKLGIEVWKIDHISRKTKAALHA